MGEASVYAKNILKKGKIFRNRCDRQTETDSSNLVPSNKSSLKRSNIFIHNLVPCRHRKIEFLLYSSFITMTERKVDALALPLSRKWAVGGGIKLNICRRAAASII